MIILDKPFVSDELKKYINEMQIPILNNATALTENKGYHFNIKDSNALIENVKTGERIYTVSETSLEWIYQNIHDNTLISCIDMMKDKVVFRKLLSEKYPDFFFREVNIQDLQLIEYESLPIPLVLKPSIGFFSVGVYTITNQNDWENALASIGQQATDWNLEYPASVVNNASFILEQYILGDEYAIDAYYDSQGETVVLNIMKHDFASISDVSDRLYYTSKEIINEYLEKFTEFLNSMNTIIKAKNFPFHVEVRVENGTIVPIEFNPMRFAGWCCTDLVYFAFGIRTYDYYLQDKKPNWNTLLAGKEDTIYTLIVLNKPENCNHINHFDYEALVCKFEKVLCMRKIDYQTFPTFGFVFTETRKENLQELDYIIQSNLMEFTS